MQDTVELPTPANEAVAQSPFLIVRGLVKRFGSFTALK
jgi:hypothetical protein